MNPDQPGSSGLAQISASSSPAELCKICLQLFTEPYSTICGHTYCLNCISRHLKTKLSCPLCEADLDPTNPNHLIPNHTAAALIENVKKNRRNNMAYKRMARALKAEIDPENMGDFLEDVDPVEGWGEKFLALKRRREEISLNDDQKKVILLNEFFDQLIQRKQREFNNLEQKLKMLISDKQKVNDFFKQAPGPSYRIVPEHVTHEAPVHEAPVCSHIQIRHGPIADQVDRLKVRIKPNLSSLESCYNEIKEAHPVPEERLGDGLGDDLDELTSVLTGMSQYVQIKRLATLNYNVDASSQLSIVSSIEFDKDGEYFVVAGVTKKIKLYDYSAVIHDGHQLHYPLHQLQCSSKISNISWNPYVKSMLASSDYDGQVALWDTGACKNVRTFKEHEKRCWTVQFNNVDPFLMASGSDDAKVKLWSVNQAHSILTVDAKVNVCCVYFSPTNRNNFVFGSADHGVHLYDLRNTSHPVNVFRGHRKAVSYVKYCSENEVVSASTDSNLRVWDVKTGACKRVMKGHLNEKNFVGLATDGNHMVCGSENNQLYVYFKSVSEPIMNYNFASRQSEISDIALVNPAENTSADFVSAVCWKKNSNVVVAANSQGTTHILELF